MDEYDLVLTNAENGTVWLLRNMHPESHTIDDILYGIHATKDRQDDIPCPTGGRAYVFGTAEGQPYFAVYQSRNERGTWSGRYESTGELLELCSGKGGPPVLFLPLATRLTVGGIHRLVKHAEAGRHNPNFGDPVGSVVSEVDTAIGIVTIARAWRH